MDAREQRGREIAATKKLGISPTLLGRKRACPTKRSDLVIYGQSLSSLRLPEPGGHDCAERSSRWLVRLEFSGY
jgi:hypothetical protein